MKHTFLTFTLSFFSFINVFAYDFTAICETGQELAYIINEDKKTVCVFKNSNVSGELIIPANVEYDSKIYRVTSIGERAFYGCCNLTSVSIPIGVTSIGEGAFCACSNLTSVSIPMGVTSIGERAFCECSGLTSITIPESVTSIERGAFSNCSGLTSITIPESVISIGYHAFYGCSALTSIIVEEGNTAYDSRNNCNAIIETKTNTLIAGCNNTTIPMGVTSIGERAFCECSGLTSITIPESVTSIERGAFSNCSGLTSITIPESVISIGYHAFSGCSGLTSVSIPMGVTSIGEGTFSKCSGLTSITIPESVTSIERGAFSNCSGLTSITIPESVISIGYHAFYGCSALTSIIVEEGNTAYDSRNNCNAIIETKTNTLIAGCNNTTIPIGVTSIGEGAFYGCSGLTSVSIPTGVTSIGYYAFYGCSALTSVSIPMGVTSSIGEYAFCGCSALTSISIPIGVTSIGERAFKGCSALTSISIPIGVTSIGESAFYGCSNLTSITIPEGVTSIGNFAFEDCSRLTSITIPESVISIGHHAFNFTYPKEVTCYAIIPPKTDYCFHNSSIRYLYIPCESKEDYVTLWGWCAKYVECINTGTVDLLTKDKVVVEPRKTEAMFSMPKNENANSYTLTISNNDVTLCTLTFNAQGQLANIDLSTSKSYELKLGIAGFQFTVTGLSTASNYEYSFKVFGENPKDPRKSRMLKEYTGSFTTQNEDGTGGSVQGGEGRELSSQGGSTAVSEVSNATAVTIVNGQILVNGEAPAFVVTVAGQKIANANLKAGVYFVNVEGETVKVVVK